MLNLNFILRKRIKFFVLVVGFLSIIFIFYQLFYLNQLTEELNHVSIRGTHMKQALFYRPTNDYLFKCIESGEIIDFSQVNDNYCDCMDGTDEPGTSACPNGVFYCAKQTTKHKNFFPSSMVNDGICDCCDGSDEWHTIISSVKLSKSLQESLGRYISPCREFC